MHMSIQHTRDVAPRVLAAAYGPLGGLDEVNAAKHREHRLLHVLFGLNTSVNTINNVRKWCETNWT